MEVGRRANGFMISLQSQLTQRNPSRPNLRGTGRPPRCTLRMEHNTRTVVNGESAFSQMPLIWLIFTTMRKIYYSVCRMAQPQVPMLSRNPMKEVRTSSCEAVVRCLRLPAHTFLSRAAEKYRSTESTTRYSSSTAVVRVVMALPYSSRISWFPTKHKAQRH